MKHKLVLLWLTVLVAVCFTSALESVEAQSSNGNITFQPNVISITEIYERVGKNKTTKELNYTYGSGERFRFAWCNNTFDLELFFNTTHVNVTRLFSLRDFEDDFNVTVDYVANRTASRIQFGWIIDNVENVSDLVHNAWFKIEDSSFDYDEIELETIEAPEEPYNITKLPDNLVLSFEDLHHKGFIIGHQNKTAVNVKGFSGKSRWNLDPITYSTNKVTASSMSNVSMRDFYNADKTGDYTWYSRSKSGTDTDWVATTGHMRPCDEVVLGGGSNDLWINVNLFIGSSPKTLDIQGTDRDDAYQTESFSFTGTGQYYFTKWFKTINGTKITSNAVGLLGYELYQGQWGVIANPLSVNDYNSTSWISYAEIHITSSNFIETDSRIEFREESDIGSLDYGFYLTNSNFTLGELVDLNTYSTRKGVTVVTNDLNTLIASSEVSPCDSISLYGCYVGQIEDAGCASMLFGGNVIICNTVFSGCSVYVGGDVDIFDVVILDNDKFSGVSLILGGSTVQLQTATINELRCVNVTRYLGFGVLSGDVTLHNFFGRDYSNASITDPYYANVYLVNPDLDAWTFYWVGGSYEVYRQYEFVANITDGCIPIQNANVTIYDNRYNNGTWYNVGSWLTWANGTFQTQTLTKEFFNQTGGNTPYSYEPINITVTANGYRTYTQNITLDKEKELTIALSENSVPSSRFTFSPSDPEPAETITFNASLSEDADGSISSYSWNFGDGDSNTSQIVYKSYASEGIYPVNLTVTDDQGATSSFVQSVTVEEAGEVTTPSGITKRIAPDFDINILQSPSYVVTTSPLWQRYFTVKGTIHNKGDFQQEVTVEYKLKNEETGEVAWEKSESFLLQARETRPIDVDFIIPNEEGSYTLSMQVADPSRGEGSLAQQTIEVKSVLTFLVTDGLFLLGISIGVPVVAVVGYGVREEWFSDLI